MPWPVVRLPLGQMEAHPLRLHEEHGTVLSHLSLRRRHSAQDIAPLARLSSCSCDFAVRSLSSLRAAERGMAGTGAAAGEERRTSRTAARASSGLVKRAGADSRAPDAWQREFGSRHAPRHSRSPVLFTPRPRRIRPLSCLFGAPALRLLTAARPWWRCARMF